MRFRVLVAFLALTFATLYTAEGFLYRDYNLDEFQVATGYLKDRDPSLYASDFIWSKPEMTRNLHVNVRRLMAFTDTITLHQISEPINLFILWLPFCILFFFAGIYLLAERFTGDRWASLWIACCFMLPRRTIWDWWGLGPLFTMSARGTVLSLIPLALWIYFKYQQDLRRLALAFLVWGWICNLHPLSGWGLIELLGITILFSERFRARAWLKVIVMGVATLVGSIPFILIWTQVTVIPEAARADPAILKPFWDHFGGISPPSMNYVWFWAQDLALPLALSVVGFLVWHRRGRPGDPEAMRVLAWFPFVVLIMTVLVMITGYQLRQSGKALPVMIPEHSRSEKFIYLTLCVWMTFALSGWLRRTAGQKQWIRWSVPCLVLTGMLCINPPGHKLIREGLMRLRLWPEKARLHWQARLKQDQMDHEVARWALQNTSHDALFYFDSYEFRYEARRSLVFCMFDRPCVAYHPSKELEEWIRRRDRIQPLKKTGDSAGMLRAARDYKADYLVLLNNWKPLPDESPPLWSNEKYSIYAVKKSSLCSSSQ